jgi:hypothetical protein
VNPDDELLDLAVSALAQGQTESAGKSWERLIHVVNDRHGGDQKEMAQALQLLAKRVETKLGAETAFRFKQRSCEVLLVFNMESRRSGRKSMPPPSGAGADGDELQLAKMANLAVAQVDRSVAEKMIEGIITELERKYEHDQREVAAALKRLSRQMEADGAGQNAFEFKQRSCEVMLKMSMASRRRAPN